MSPESENPQGSSAELPATNPAPTAGPGDDKRYRWALVIVAAVLVIYMVMRPSRQSGSPVNSPQADAFLTQSLEHYQAGRFQESINAAKQVLALNPKSAEAYNNIAASYMSMHMPHEAFQNIQEALHLKPDFPLAQNNREWILREMKSPAATPGSAEAYVNDSLAHYQAGRWEECLKAAREAARLKPDMPEAHNNIAAALAKLQKWDEAYNEINLALRLKPDFPLAKNNLAWISGERSKKK
jgi:tetratricopeptide (TPR) repeat protein